MADKQLALEVSAFMDSRGSRAIGAARPEEVREITELFVELCHGSLGKAPRLLDGDDVRELMTRLLPSRLRAKDPLAEHVPAVLAAYVEHLEATQLVSQAFEVRRAIETATPEFLAAVTSGRHAGELAPARSDPFVHGAKKLGRNDPCSCGSGKKFKKCHGAGA